MLGALLYGVCSFDFFQSNFSIPNFSIPMPSKILQPTFQKHQPINKAFAFAAATFKFSLFLPV